MRKRIIKAAGMLGFALLLAGSVFATDSSFYWSDASGARGTLYWDSIVLSNSTFGGTLVSGLNGSGITNLNGANISSGDIPVDRVAWAATNLTAVGKPQAVIKGNLGTTATNLATAGIALGGANVKSLLDCADNAAMRTALGLAIGTDVQAYSANLTPLASNNGSALTNLNGANLSSGNVPVDRVSWAATNLVAVGLPTTLLYGNAAGITNVPTAGLVLGGANVKSLLDCADYSAMRTALSLRPGTDIQAYSSNLTPLSSNNGGSLTNLPVASMVGGYSGTITFVNGGGVGTNIIQYVTNGVIINVTN